MSAKGYGAMCELLFLRDLVGSIFGYYVYRIRLDDDNVLAVPKYFIILTNTK